MNLNLVYEDVISENSTTKNSDSSPLPLHNLGLSWHPSIGEETVLKLFIPTTELPLDHISVTRMVKRATKFTVTFES
jgi:hypothetical protein